MRSHVCVSWSRGSGRRLVSDRREAHCEKSDAGKNQDGHSKTADRRQMKGSLHNEGAPFSLLRILRAGMDALLAFTSQDVTEQEANQERASDYERSVLVGIFADTPGSFPNLPLSSGYFRGVVVYDSSTGRLEVIERL